MREVACGLPTADAEQAGSPMPRVKTWKAPLALFLVGLFVAKPVLSLLIDDTAGNWAAGAFGFVGMVTLVLYLWDREHPAEGGPPSP